MASSAEIVPTILANSLEQYQKFVAAYQGFAKRVQIDICDGQFTPAITISENDIAIPENWQADFHMMVARPSEHLASLIAKKPHLVIFHAETGENLIPIFEQLHESGIKCGVALVKSTFPGSIEETIKAADHVLVFGGELGRQGGLADLLQTEKVPLIQKINPDVELGWDGGANMTNVRAITRAGFSVINVGSALSTAQNPAAVFEELTKETDRRGVAL